MRHLDSLRAVTKREEALNTNVVVFLRDHVTVSEKEAADLLSAFQRSV